MDRPYVVCHILTSLNGKIDGDFFADQATAPAQKAYGSLRNVFECQATIYGTTTMLGGYSNGSVPTLTPKGRDYPKEDYKAPNNIQNYIVSVDPEGILGWQSNTIEKKGRAKAHVIEVLTEKVDGAYVDYLRQHEISYIFAGKDSLDCIAMLKKLKEEFHVDRLMLAGGGVMNASFLQANVIDELSLVLAPVVGCDSDAVSIFEQAEFLPDYAPAAFELEEAKPLDGNGLWLRYKREAI